MSPEQQAAAHDAARRAQFEQAAGQAREAGLAFARGQAPRRAVLEMLEKAAAELAAGETPGSPWLEVTGLCLALAALIKGAAIPPVPAQYAAHFSAVQQELATLAPPSQSGTGSIP